MIQDTDGLAAVRGTETLVICGAPRGMTSVVSFALYELGYYLGDDLILKNYEDKEVLAAIPHRRLLAPGQLSGREQLLKLVEKRNKDHTRWGFKPPLALGHAAELDRMLRNPVFVVCVRNPLAVATSVHRREDCFSSEIDRPLEIGFTAVRELEDMLQLVSAPVVMVNMDAASQSPGVFLDELTTALGLSGDLKAIEQALATPGYKPLRKKA